MIINSLNDSNNLINDNQDNISIPNDNNEKPTYELFVNNVNELFPELNKGLPINYDYMPTIYSATLNIQNVASYFGSNSKKLTRKIYLDSLKVIDIYTRLISYEDENFEELIKLRTQMQIISAVILNIYQSLEPKAPIPLRLQMNSVFPNGSLNKYVYLYKKIYNLYILTLYLQQLKTKNNLQLEIIIANLKNQLQEISYLVN